MVTSNFHSLNLWRKGKVRDVYDVGNELLIVATDRISAFDVVFNEPIPDKGKILTKISTNWFKLINDIPNHLISTNVSEYPVACKPYSNELEGRSMLVKKAMPFPVECIVRGYLAGSGWKEYQKDNSVCGISLPNNLKLSSRLPEPIFTPSTKAESGHDQNIIFKEMENIIGSENAGVLRNYSLKLYSEASKIALSKGIIIADTKVEFGLDQNQQIILIDEVLTPDSSRFWQLDSYTEGMEQPSFDKQFLRNYLETLAWDKTPPPPTLPIEIITQTRAKYLEALERFGLSL